MTNLQIPAKACIMGMFSSLGKMWCPKLVTTTAKSGLIADNQYGKIYGSSPAGPTLKHFHLEVLFFAKNFEEELASLNVKCVIITKSMLWH